MPEKRSIFNMAPTIQQREIFNSFRTELINFSHTMCKIDTMDTLCEAKKQYLAWAANLKKFLTNTGYLEKTTVLFLNDKVITHGMESGAGTFFGDNRSLTLLDAIEKEVESKILRLDRLSDLFNINKVIEKHNYKFYYCTKEIILGKNTNPYHLLDVLYISNTEDGFVSYEKIKQEFKKRRISKILSSKDISKKTITNARLELFRRATIEESGEKLPECTPSGTPLISPDRKRKGFVFNNEVLK